MHQEHGAQSEEKNPQLYIYEGPQLLILLLTMEEISRSQCTGVASYGKCLYPRLLKMMRARSSIISVRGGWMRGGETYCTLSLAHAPSDVTRGIYIVDRSILWVFL